MVFVDSAYWADDRLGAPKLLKQLAGERPYADLIGVFDDPNDVVDFIESHPPIVADELGLAHFTFHGDLRCWVHRE